LGPLKDFLARAGIDLPKRNSDLHRGDKEKAPNWLDISLATLYRKLSEDEAA